jgi:hypothetical protein
MKMFFFQACDLDSDIEELPDGYNTEVCGRIEDEDPHWIRTF